MSFSILGRWPKIYLYVCVHFTLVDPSSLHLLSLMHQGHSLIEAAMKQQKRNSFTFSHCWANSQWLKYGFYSSDQFSGQEMTKSASCTDGSANKNLSASNTWKSKQANTLSNIKHFSRRVTNKNQWVYKIEKCLMLNLIIHFSMV